MTMMHIPVHRNVPPHHSIRLPTPSPTPYPNFQSWPWGWCRSGWRPSLSTLRLGGAGGCLLWSLIGLCAPYRFFGLCIGRYLSTDGGVPYRVIEKATYSMHFSMHVKRSGIVSIAYRTQVTSEHRDNAHSLQNVSKDKWVCICRRRVGKPNQKAVYVYIYH
jgi:hypothetical protein